MADIAPNTTRAGEMLRAAAGIVDGARNATHGDKERSFAAIARMWNGYLLSRKEPQQAITAADVAAMMVLMKMMRSQYGEHIADHAVDAAGYAAIWGELRESEPVTRKIVPAAPSRRDFIDPATASDAIEG